jgi:diguanylate cyclase (GGDEF)-like protein/PAS domain S-box-containing protein
MSGVGGPLRVLLVEDSPGDAALVRAALLEAAPEAELCWVDTIAAAEVALETDRWSCILLDLGLPDADGPEALERTLEAASGTPVVVLTGHADERAGNAAVAAGAQDYLVKGNVSPQLLVRALAYAIERHRLGRELQLLLDSAGEGVFATDVEGLCTFANRAACDLLGYERSALIGRRVHDVLHVCPPLDGGDDCSLAAALTTATELWVADDWFRRADGEVFATELSCAPITDGGVARGAVVSFFDITERRRVEEALRTSETRYRTIVETAEEGIWLLDVDGITTFVNHSMARMLGYEPHEMVGTPSADYLGDAGPHPAFTHRGERVEVRLLHRDGGELWTLFSTSPTFGDAGAEAGVLVMVSDITSRRRAEEGVRQLAAIVEHSNDAIFSEDLEGVVLSWNDAASRIFGFDASEIVGSSIDAIVPADRLHEGHFIHDATRQGRSVEHFETVRVRNDGRVIDVSLTASPTRNAIGEVVGMSVIARDITERKRSVTWLAAQSKVLGMVAQGKPLGETLEAVARIVEGDSAETSCVVVLTDPDSGETQQSAGRRYEAGEDGQPASWSIPVKGEGDNRILGAITVYQRDRSSPTSGELARAELAARLVAIAVERTRFEERLVHQALHDSLTMLPNRALFMDRLGSAIMRASRGGSTAAVLFLDLDRFKVVNDSLGHAAGDALLREVVVRLQALLRPSDTIARLGGDEFAVLCEELGEERQVTEVADRIERALRLPFTIRGAEVHVSTSIGIAMATDPEATPESLLRDADAAMYQAKDRGRARYELFDQALRAKATRRLEIENALRHAIDNGELRVHYQPEVDLVTGAVTGVEALVRWQHPEQGLLLPGAFIPVAEETGLIVPLGQWVLEEVCAQRRRWTEAHPGWPPLGISVNISARQLTRADLPQMVASTLALNGIPAAALCLEITETVFMEDVEMVSVAFDALRRLGVRVAVDDFGTGYSSLVYLKRFPVRRLKIDRRFVDGLGHDADDAAIVAGVVSLAHGLGLEAVAEGVERPEQLAALRATECDLAQGFHWSEALAPAAFEVWMAEQAAAWESGGNEVAARRLSPEQTRSRALAAAAGAEASILKATAEARAAFASARVPGEAVQALVTFVHRLGGTVSPASAHDPRAIPVDLSFGEGEPILPVCDSFSVTRMHLIRLLPVMAEEARSVIDTLRAPPLPVT